MTGTPGRAYAVRTLHQIEVTSRCNLACRYCLHPIMKRPKQDMTRETWDQALDWLRYYVRQGTQGELVLYGTGEPLLHPRFVEMVAEARAVIGERPLFFTTNGLLMDTAMVAALKPYQVRVWVSLHRPEHAGPAVLRLREAGMLERVSIEPSVAPMDWAGQVDWPVSVEVPEGRVVLCEYLQVGWLFCDSTGRLCSCCTIDDQADGVVGHVSEAPHPVAVHGYQLCASCWMPHPEPWQVKTRIVAREAA